MGRPPLPPEEVRSEFVTIRVTKREKKKLQAEAKKSGMTVGDLLMRSWRSK